jgi:mono/diheme cytochrome c family protein
MDLRLVLALLFVAGTDAGALAGNAPVTLRFMRDGQAPRTIDLATLTAHCAVATVTLDDPNYLTRKSFRACPLGDVLAFGFGESVAALRGQSVVFRARDGYTKPADGALLGEPGGFLAFADADHMHGDDPGWQPIARTQTDPGPFYLVWTGGQQDSTSYPWPYQLTEIEITPPERLYPHIAPITAALDSPAYAGYAIFKSQCIACHAINGEGGTVGPDLNIPQSIVEYRPADQIKAYVHNPLTFRYTSMPPHPQLSDRQLDDLVAYFNAMNTLKHDPHRQP